MERAEALRWAIQATETEYLQKAGLRRVVLELYDAEHIGLRKYLTCLGVNRENGREILQDCFLKLHEHLAAAGDRSNLRAWLYRVAHNLARNRQKSIGSSRTQYLSDFNEQVEFAADDLSIEQQLLAAERHRQLKESLQLLNTKERECLVLRSRGLKYREIGQVLDCTVSTVSENLQRAIARVREALGEETQK